MEKEEIKMIAKNHYDVVSAFQDLTGLSEGIQTAIKQMYILGFECGHLRAQEDKPQKNFLTWYTTGNNKHYSGDKLIEKYKKEVLNQ